MTRSKLPDHWRAVELGQVALIVMGQSPPGDTYNTRGDGKPLLNGPAEFGLEYPKPIQWTTAPSRLCQPGDILFCVRGNTTGRMNFADQEYCIGRGIAAVRGRRREASTGFLQFALEYERSAIYDVAAGGGSTFPNINAGKLQRYPIALPPLAEQHAIARGLQAVQDAKKTRRRELTLERERKAALMQHLFTHGTRGEPTTQTEVGEIPKSWAVATFADVVEVTVQRN